MDNCRMLMEMVCDKRAFDQKISGDAKDTFTKNCVKDSVDK